MAVGIHGHTGAPGIPEGHGGRADAEHDRGEGAGQGLRAGDMVRGVRRGSEGAEQPHQPGDQFFDGKDSRMGTVKRPHVLWKNVWKTTCVCKEYQPVITTTKATKSTKATEHIPTFYVTNNSQIDAGQQSQPKFLNFSKSFCEIL